MAPRELQVPGLRTCLQRDLYLLCCQYPSRAKRIRVALTNRGFHAVLLYRLAHFCWRRRIPLLPLLLTRVAQTFLAVDISPEARLGPGIVIVHGFGIVIGSATQIEGDCRIFHGVTFGDRGSEWIASKTPDGHPYVEKNCMFAAGAKVLGPITIGWNSVVGANAVVLSSLEPSSIAAGIPARVVGKRPVMDERLRPVTCAEDSLRPDERTLARKLEAKQ